MSERNVSGLNVSGRKERRAAARAVLALLIAGFAGGMATSSRAEPEIAPWFEMVRACEAVLKEQSFSALAGFAPAPFSSGMPGVKEYAVFNKARSLVVVARQVKGAWEQCLVREHTEDRARWRDLARAWEEGFEAAFADGAYRPVKARYNPDRPFHGAVRCDGDRFVMLVMPTLEWGFQFRVVVANTPVRSGAKICAGG